MNFNLDDLVKFYASELGKTCVKIIQNKLMINKIDKYIFIEISKGCLFILFIFLSSVLIIRERIIKLQTLT